jgi:hypothetical protein
MIPAFKDGGGAGGAGGCWAATSLTLNGKRQKDCIMTTVQADLDGRPDPIPTRIDHVVPRRQ